MKKLLFLFLVCSLNGLAQVKEEIFLQTRPESSYIMSYTYGKYTFLFDYEDFLRMLPLHDAETKANIRTYFDGQLQAHAIVSLNKNHKIMWEGEETSLREMIEKTMVRKLLRNGNLVITDAYGKPVISHISYTTSYEGRLMETVVKDPATDQVIFECAYYGFRMSGCPSF